MKFSIQEKQELHAKNRNEKTEEKNKGRVRLTGFLQRRYGNFSTN